MHCLKTTFTNLEIWKGLLHTDTEVIIPFKQHPVRDEEYNGEIMQLRDLAKML